MGKNQKNHQNVPEMMPHLIQNEQGRSMVEMLGVLAIVGVLSVGAISGYRYAMNKYRANQLVNDVNMRMNTLKVQSEADKPLDLSEWGKRSQAGYLFEDPTMKDGKVSLSILGLSKSICQIAKNGMPGYQVIVNNSDKENTACSDLENGNKLTFVLQNENEDYKENNDNPDDTAIDTDYADYPCFPQDGGNSGVGCECSIGEYVYESQCLKACPEGTSVEFDLMLGCQCFDGTNYSDCEYNCPEGSVLNEHTLDCVKCDENGKCVCTSNKDCSNGEYCFMRNSSPNDQSSVSGDEFATGYGICRNAKSDAVQLNDGYIISKPGMSWWSAQRFCDALNKHQLTVSEFYCEEEGFGKSCKNSPVLQIMRNQSRKYIDLWTATESLKCGDGGRNCSVVFVLDIRGANFSVGQTYAGKGGSRIAICH